MTEVVGTRKASTVPVVAPVEGAKLLGTLPGGGTRNFRVGGANGLATNGPDGTPLVERIGALEAGQAAGQIVVTSWDDLAAIATTAEGRRGAQVVGDGGTHTDPVSATSVPNAGQYVETVDGWQWVRGDLLAGKADKADLRQSVADLSATDNEIMRTYYDRAYADDPSWHPLVVNELGQLIAGINRVTGKFACSMDWEYSGFSSVADYKLSTVLPDNVVYADDPTHFPIVVNGAGALLLGIRLSDGAVVGNFTADSTAGFYPITGYLHAGEFHATGGPWGHWIVDDLRTWLAVTPIPGGALSVHLDASVPKAVRVSLPSGNRYTDSRVCIWTSDGQSNAEGQAGTANRRVVYGEGFGHPARVRMPVTAANNLWLGKTTSGGTSVELTAAEITGLGPALSKIASTNQHGTLPVEGAVRRRVARAAADFGGWVPEYLLWTNAEGGQSAAGMAPGASGKFYFANIVTALTRVGALLRAEGKSGVYEWAFMDQGESDPADSQLGSKHAAIRSQMQTAALDALGQTEPLRMMSSQMSSFQANRQGVQSILDYALNNEVQWGDFWCLGPTYIYPWHTDYLHNSSIGHAMRGEFAEAAVCEFERTGYWRPLHMVSARVTGAAEVTVTMSEDVVIDDAWLVAPIANAGVQLIGGTIASLEVSGNQLVIATAAAASAVTAVSIAYTGHGSTRAAETVPRSTIRSVATIGTWSQECGGRAMFKPACHQLISITP